MKNKFDVLDMILNDKENQADDKIKMFDELDTKNKSLNEICDPNQFLPIFTELMKNPSKFKKVTDNIMIKYLISSVQR